MASLSEALDQFWKGLFDTTGFMPHGHCYLWRPELVWLHVGSDALIGMAYFAISVTLYLLIRRAKLPFSPLILAFGVFIGACGLTHFMEVLTLWEPEYWLSGAVKAITAFASVTTGLLLLPARSRVIAMSEGAELLEHQRRELEAKNAELKLLSDQVRAMAESERREGEAREAKVVAQLKLAFQAADAGSFDLDLTTEKAVWSEELERIYGFAPGHFQGDLAAWRDAVLPEDLAGALHGLQANIAAGHG
ncbi:MAG TPA: PAS domain-containing protein, partial [Myxococcaceae bacterium]|nr:PAS domain-containing protein [Myxococcaceae bacterium]